MIYIYIYIVRREKVSLYHCIPIHSLSCHHSCETLRSLLTTESHTTVCKILPRYADELKAITFKNLHRMLTSCPIQNRCLPRNWWGEKLDAACCPVFSGTWKAQKAHHTRPLVSFLRKREHCGGDSSNRLAKKWIPNENPLLIHANSSVKMP